MLRSTFMGFEIAKRGLTTSQKGLDITGHNMTNWDSAGYTRQRVDQVAMSVYGNTNRYNYNRTGSLGQGVNITGVGQIRDTFLDKRFRDEQSETGYFDTASMILYDIESAIGEFNPLSDSGIRGCLTSLINSLKTFTEKPYLESQANIVQTEFKNLCQTLQQIDSKLTKAAEQHKYDLKIATNELNEKFQRLAGLNYAIAQNKDVTGTDNPKYGPNELLDERNLLLDEISKYGDISVQVNEDFTVKVTMAGHTVVDGDKAEKIEYVDNGDETVALRWLSTGKQCDFTSGSLKGYTDFINGRGANLTSKNETPYKGILYYRDQLNTFASTLVNTVNNVVPDTFDADGNPLTYKTLLGALSSTMDADGNYPVDPNGAVTAKNISISDEWIEDRAYVIVKEENRGNEYMHALYNSIFKDETTFSACGESFRGTFMEFVDGYVGVLGEDYVFYSGRYEASATNLTDLQDRRDSVSGVMMDEEVANMMLYNKSYQAASRLMTTLDEALDVLINKTGLVGR